MTTRARPLRVLRVALVDDHQREQQFVERVLSTAADMDLVAFDLSHDALLARWETVSPDVVLVDVRWQPADRPFAAEERRWADFKAVAARGALTFALSVSQEARDIVNAGRNGAVGYLRKDDGARLTEQIRLVAAGEQPSLDFAEALAYLNEINDLANRLTAREFEVIELLADGLHPPEIARDWGIDAKTVNGHIASIRSKLGLYGYGAIGAWAARNGLA